MVTKGILTPITSRGSITVGKGRVGIPIGMKPTTWIPGRLVIEFGLT